jgi:phenolic acid decarboxylase
MSTVKITQLENEVAAVLLQAAKEAGSYEARSCAIRDYMDLMRARTDRVNAIPASIKQAIATLEAMSDEQQIALN